MGDVIQLETAKEKDDREWAEKQRGWDKFLATKDGKELREWEEFRAMQQYIRDSGALKVIGGVRDACAAELERRREGPDVGVET